MSKPFENIKQAIESVGRPYEEQRIAANWDEAVYPEYYEDDRGGRVDRVTPTDTSPAASLCDRPSRENKPTRESNLAFLASQAQELKLGY